MWPHGSHCSWWILASLECSASTAGTHPRILGAQAPYGQRGPASFTLSAFKQRIDSLAVSVYWDFFVHSFETSPAPATTPASANFLIRRSLITWRSTSRVCSPASGSALPASAGVRPSRGAGRICFSPFTSTTRLRSDPPSISSQESTFSNISNLRIQQQHIHEAQTWSDTRVSAFKHGHPV